MVTDPIADYLTRIRNAVSAQKKVVDIPASNLKREITRVLQEKGFISKFKFLEDNKQGLIRIALKYDKINRKPAIQGIDRISRPGLRNYKGVANLPKVMSGLGVAVLSTSRGVMTDKEARQLNVGGEVLCYVY